MRKTPTKRAAEPAATEVVAPQKEVSSSEHTLSGVKAKPYEQPPPITKRPKTKRNKSGGGSDEQSDGKSSSNNGGGGDSGAASSDANSEGGGGASGGRSGGGESEKRTTPDTGGKHGGGGGEEQAARASADTARATSGAAGTNPSAPKAKKTLMTIKHKAPSSNFEFPPFTMPDPHFEGPTEFPSAMASSLKGQKLDPYNIYPIDPANNVLTFLHQHPHWPGEFNDVLTLFFSFFFFLTKKYITPTGAPPLPLCFSHGKDAGVHGCVLLRGRERRDCRVLHLLLALPQGIWHALQALLPKHILLLLL